MRWIKIPVRFTCSVCLTFINTCSSVNTRANCSLDCLFSTVPLVTLRDVGYKINGSTSLEIGKTRFKLEEQVCQISNFVIFLKENFQALNVLRV